MPITSEPPPNPPPAGTARARVQGTYVDTSWEVGYWLDVSGTPLFSDVTDLAHAIRDAWADTIQNLASVYNVLTGVDVRYFTDGGSIDGAWHESDPGLATGDLLPASVASVLSWQIVDTYRGGKPRSYVNGRVYTQLDGPRTFSDDFVGDMQPAALAFLDAVNSITTTNITGVLMGVVHFFSAGAALDPPTFDPYIGVAVQKRVCTQRRRLGAEL